MQMKSSEQIVGSSCDCAYKKGVTTNPTTKNRAQLTQGLFPNGVPVLWCPLLSHYDGEGRIDRARMAKHFEHVARHVHGFLAPGSTSDGWELSAPEEQEVVEIALAQAGKFSAHLLVGILRPDLEQARKRLSEICDRRACGFVVCPTKGSNVSQTEMGRQLRAFLAEGVPTALYQLPQITQNEMGAELVSELAKDFPNFVLLKDSSGADRVAGSAEDFAGLFMVRGAEGDYARWLKCSGGPYNGFLLSTANCFARELKQMIEALSDGMEAGQGMSDRLSRVIGDVFRLVSPLPQGNAFTNANKAIDHFFAYGPRAAAVPAPRLHAGIPLPTEMIRETGEILQRNGFMPGKGYLE